MRCSSYFAQSVHRRTFLTFAGITRSPGFSFSTSDATAATTPTPSDPGTTGWDDDGRDEAALDAPVMAAKSTGSTPTAVQLTVMLPGGSGEGGGSCLATESTADGDPSAAYVKPIVAKRRVDATAERPTNIFVKLRLILLR